MKQALLPLNLKNVFHESSPRSILLILLATLFAVPLTNANAQQSDVQHTVSFLANIDAGQFQTVFTAVKGTQQISTEDLNNLIRPGGGNVLRIRSIHAHLLPGIPKVGDYAAFFLGACTQRQSTRGFGAGSVAVGGTANEQVTFTPGGVASLLESESLCLRSLVQSNYTVRVEVHGVLVPQSQ